MPNLVGIGNSQVPTNAMLGGLAYQDSVGEIDIEKIKARISDTANDVFISLLGSEFSDVSTYTSSILFCLPLMVWSRINIIFSRALNFEINLTKSITIGAILSCVSYYLIHNIADNPAVLSIVASQILIALSTTISFRRSYV